MQNVSKRASQTMEAVCAVRAAHGDAMSKALLIALPEADRSRDLLDSGSRGAFSRSILVRTHFFDGMLQRATESCTQLVVLSAGLDTRPYSAGKRSFRQVFSVDHVESQRLCRDLLQRVGIDAADVAFVACDLAADPAGLLQSLAAAGLDTSQATLFLWEGATYYLPPALVTQVLQGIGEALPQVAVAADFLDRTGYFRGVDPVNEGVARNLAFLAQIGEPWIGFFDREQLATDLRTGGFAATQVCDRVDVERRCFDDPKLHAGTTFFVYATTGEKPWMHALLPISSTQMSSQPKSKNAM